MKAFINSFEFPPLAEAVIKQSGGWELFTESALDVSRHGASGGYSGFIYYSETIAFFDSNRREILGLLSAESRGFVNMVDMVFGFSCLPGIDKSDIQSVLFGLDPLDECAETQVKNALAWFAFEAVCFDYANFIDA
jgi:hypothetical protein